MTTLTLARNDYGAETVRLSDDELHRAARKSLHAGNHAVFRILPVTIHQLIEHKIWKTRQRKFKSFGEYALDQTSEGLGIENNQLLWLLRCALDVSGKHVKEWASVLEEVERAVQVRAKAEGKQIRHFDGNSLEMLGKACTDQSTDNKITYLPSRNKNTDGQIISLKKRAPDVYRKFLSGEIALREATRAAGMYRKDSDINRDPFDRIIMYFGRDKKVIARVIAWLKAEGHIQS